MTNRYGIHIQKLHEDTQIPAVQTKHSVGYDLHAYLDAKRLDVTTAGFDTPRVYIHPGQIEMIPCGFKMAMSNDLEAQIRFRSSLGTKGVIIPNAPGTIDPDYRGEILVMLMNLSKKSFVVNHGDRLAQMVFARVIRPELHEVSELDTTARGEGGYGSTGQ